MRASTSGVLPAYPAFGQRFYGCWTVASERKHNNSIQSRFFQRVSAKSLTLCVLTPDSTSDSGRCFSSVRMLRFVPVFPHAVGLRPTASKANGTLTFPADSFQFIVLLQTFCPYLKKSCCRQILEILVDTVLCSIFLGYCFLLTVRPQNIKYPFQNLPFAYALCFSPDYSSDIVHDL